MTGVTDPRAIPSIFKQGESEPIGRDRWGLLHRIKAIKPNGDHLIPNRIPSSTGRIAVHLDRPHMPQSTHQNAAFLRL